MFGATECLACKDIVVNPMSDTTPVKQPPIADVEYCHGGERINLANTTSSSGLNTTKGTNVTRLSAAVILPMAGYWIHMTKTRAGQLLPCESTYACTAITKQDVSEVNGTALDILQPLRAVCGENFTGFMWCVLEPCSIVRTRTLRLFLMLAVHFPVPAALHTTRR